MNPCDALNLAVGDFAQLFDSLFPEDWFPGVLNIIMLPIMFPLYLIMLMLGIRH